MAKYREKHITIPTITVPKNQEPQRRRIEIGKTQPQTTRGKQNPGKSERLKFLEKIWGGLRLLNDRLQRKGQRQHPPSRAKSNHLIKKEKKALQNDLIHHKGSEDNREKRTMTKPHGVLQKKTSPRTCRSSGLVLVQVGEGGSKNRRGNQKLF